jgi:hypothetical protein
VIGTGCGGASPSHLSVCDLTIEVRDRDSMSFDIAIAAARVAFCFLTQLLQTEA